MRLHIREKTTHRTWQAIWPWQDGIALCWMTGSKHLVTVRAGYTEYNDRGEPVLDSWTEPTAWVVIPN